MVCCWGFFDSKRSWLGDEFFVCYLFIYFVNLVANEDYKVMVCYHFFERDRFEYLYWVLKENID